jgi:hypothetical protein
VARRVLADGGVSVWTSRTWAGLTSRLIGRSAISENHQAAATNPSAAGDRYRTTRHPAKYDVGGIWQSIDAVVPGSVGVTGAP